MREASVDVAVQRGTGATPRVTDQRDDPFDARQYDAVTLEIAGDRIDQHGCGLGADPQRLQ